VIALPLKFRGCGIAQFFIEILMKKFLYERLAQMSGEALKSGLRQNP
jgi:hypothetical protein